MDGNDVKKLFSLLAELYPKQAPKATEERIGAWLLVLKPYKYDAIRAAAIAHARVNGYYPTIAEITSNLPKPAGRETVSPAEDAGLAWQAEIDAGRCKDAADVPFSVSRYAREHGLTWPEAKAECVRLGLCEA